VKAVQAGQGTGDRITGEAALAWVNGWASRMFAAATAESVDLRQLVVIGIASEAGVSPTTVMGIGDGPMTPILRREITAALRKAAAEVNKGQAHQQAEVIQ
jgi:hypothetical protein